MLTHPCPGFFWYFLGWFDISYDLTFSRGLQCLCGLMDLQWGVEASCGTPATCQRVLQPPWQLFEYHLSRLFFWWFWMWGKYSKTSESESTTGLRLGSRPVFACTESRYFLKSLILYWCVSTDGININCHYQWLYGISHPPPE